MKRHDGIPTARPGLACWLLLCCLLTLPLPLAAQVLPPSTTGQQLRPEPQGEDTISPPSRVDIRPTSRDEEIAERLQGILASTDRFDAPLVRVRDGVAFLHGQTPRAEFKQWAGELAGNTQDVAAVVNEIEVVQPFTWDFKPALAGLHELWRSLLASLPYLAFSLLILFLAWLFSRFARRIARGFMQRREVAPLLRDVIARGVALLVMLVGLFVVFHVAGLTAIAFTIMGGTGLLGIVLGIAFRDITENLLASIFLSVQNPFSTGDLIELEGITGFVQRLTIRATILMSLDGNHIQIPNATVYKSTIRNFTSNPNRRQDFVIGIGYDDSVSRAQEVARKVLAEHPAVLKDPEPWVLINDLGKATVNLRIYFWLDGRKHSWLKARSSVIRLVKAAFQAERISMPDEAREIVFPKGVPVQLLDSREKAAPQPQTARDTAAQETTAASTSAEGGLDSEATEIEQQALHSRTPEEGKNLLKPTRPDLATKQP